MCEGEDAAEEAAGVHAAAAAQRSDSVLPVVQRRRPAASAEPRQRTGESTHTPAHFNLTNQTASFTQTFCSTSQAVLSALLPVLDRLLEQSGPDAPTLLRDEAQLMQLVLRKYNEASAPLLAEDQNCLDLFVRALRTSTQQHPDIPSCQIFALEQVRLKTRIKISD